MTDEDEVMDESEREALIDRYAAGPERLAEALSRVPNEAKHWRPEPGEWSAHEIVWHCADVEPVVSGRIRYLVVENEPTIVALDQDAWARLPGYRDLPLEPALALVTATRAATAALLRALPAESWSRFGHHTEHGRYSSEDWLRVYADHLHDHADQIERNVLAWKRANG